MNNTLAPEASAVSAEEKLRDTLATSDVVLATTRPILRHLLANRDETLFSDEIIARVRGMIGHVAQQMLYARGEADDIYEVDQFAARHGPELAQHLFEDIGFLSHAHAMALEGQLSEQLQRRCGIDSVLSPLMQELAASSDPQVAGGAMRCMAQQARFIQQYRRMEMPLGELPGDLFHKALVIMRSHAGSDLAAEEAEAKLRGDYDEARSRLGQLTRLITGMGRHAHRALAVDHAGLAIFSTALAMASGQDRNLAILSFSQNQVVRLAISLRAAGLKPAAVQEQFLYLHPDTTPPEGLDELSIETASKLLSSSQLELED